MGKKYIIELLDKCNSEFKGIMLFGLTQEKQISVEMIPEESMTPYIEPDLDAIHKEAYDKAFEDAEQVAESGKKVMYRRGLNDAWETVKELFGFTFDEQVTIFKTTSVRDIVRKYSASECIKKIRQYEEKEEIRVGDEVEDGVANIIVLEINEDGTVSGFDDEGSIIHATPRKKTGRHFPEIAEALRKMKE